ncbi:MAG: hypothetical protein JWP15_3368 [Alphaproteobacteria bacterium]|nr:hypothetical protein [Alphaproteobacteria bacterium]
MMARKGEIGGAAAPPIVQDSPVAWRRRKDQRRPELLAAARALIEEEGADSVSMVRIAKSAGVSEATVYKYFENKEDLVNQVLREWATPFIDRLVDELAPLTEVRSRLVLIAIRYLRSFEETPRLHRVFFREIRWGDYKTSAMRELNVKFVAQVVDTILRAQSAGQVSASFNPNIVRDMLFGGLEHIALRTIFASRAIDIEREAADYVDMMLHGLTPRTENADPGTELSRLAGLVDRMEAVLEPGTARK